MSTIKNPRENRDRYLLGRIDIQTALRSGWTTDEKNPPDDSEYSDWLVPVNFVPSDKLQQLIDFTSQTYGHGPKKAARRLHRFGAPEIMETITDGTFESVNQYQDVATYASAHSRGVSYGYSPLNENEKVPINWGHTTGNRKETFKVVWSQDAILKEVSEKLCITKADAFRWSAFEAGKAMGDDDLLPDALYDDVVENVEEMRAYIGDKIISIKGPAVITILEAYIEGYGPEIAEYCRQQAPDLWDEFMEYIGQVHVELEETEFLFPDRFGFE